MPQHMDALARANEVRLARAQLKQQIRAGQIRIEDVLRDVPWEVETMTVSDLLLSQKGWGLIRTNKILSRVPVSPMKTVGTLTTRQKERISDLLFMTPNELR